MLLVGESPDTEVDVSDPLVTTGFKSAPAKFLPTEASLTIFGSCDNINPAVTIESVKPHLEKKNKQKTN